MPDPSIVLLLALAGLSAGFVDAVVGGGGLIQLPALLLGLPGASPVQVLATNKLSSICGTTSPTQPASSGMYSAPAAASTSSVIANARSGAARREARRLPTAAPATLPSRYVDSTAENTYVSPPTTNRIVRTHAIS